MVIGDGAGTHPPTIRGALTEGRCRPEAVLEHIGEGADVIVGMFNSEPLTVLDALEAGAGRLSDVRIHQMFPPRERSQPDFARGALFSERGQSFIVLHATAAAESISRIVAQLHPGAVLTSFKNTVDCVVTEYGMAKLRGSSIRERTRKLIGIAHPKFRDELERQAREMGCL